MGTRDIFNKMYDADPNSKSDYFKKGSGRAVVLEMLKKNGDSGEVFVIRAKILEAKGKDGSVPNQPGDRVGWPQLLTKFPKTAYANIQGAILALVGASKEQVPRDDFVAAYEDAINYVKGTKSEYNGREINEVQAARGMLIDFDTYDQQTKAQKASSSKETNTYVKFYHVADQGDVAARRAELDKTDPIQG